jgi:hypothetical protein
VRSGRRTVRRRHGGRRDLDVSHCRMLAGFSRRGPRPPGSSRNIVWGPSRPRRSHALEGRTVKGPLRSEAARRPNSRPVAPLKRPTWRSLSAILWVEGAHFRGHQMSKIPTRSRLLPLQGVATEAGRRLPKLGARCYRACACRYVSRTHHRRLVIRLRSGRVALNWGRLVFPAASIRPLTRGNAQRCEIVASKER